MLCTCTFSEVREAVDILRYKLCYSKAIYRQGSMHDGAERHLTPAAMQVPHESPDMGGQARVSLQGPSVKLWDMPPKA